MIWVRRDAAKFADGHSDFAGAPHWFNPLVIAPDGSRLQESICAGSFRRDFAFCLTRSGAHAGVADHPSHGEKFDLYKDRTEEVEVAAPDVMTVNVHCTYLPGNRWILYDTYPDTDRRQLPIGHFLSPMPYPAEWRCDPHPRYSPDGRQMYLIDIGDLRA